MYCTLGPQPNIAHPASTGNTAVQHAEQLGIRRRLKCMSECRLFGPTAMALTLDRIQSLCTTHRPTCCSGNARGWCYGSARVHRPRPDEGKIADSQSPEYGLPPELRSRFRDARTRGVDCGKRGLSDGSYATDGTIRGGRLRGNGLAVH